MLFKSLVANFSRLVLVVVLVLGGLGDASGSSFSVSGVELEPQIECETSEQVKAWELATNSGFPKAWTGDPDFLTNLRNVWDYRFVNGNAAKLPNVELLPTSLTKISTQAKNSMRAIFDAGPKKDFLKSLGNRSDISQMLSKAGFSNNEFPGLVQRLKAGQGIPGHQVHHKIPLTFGGSNDFSNLVLMKNSPFHTAVTSYGNTKIPLSVGQTQVLDFPMVPGAFYSPPYIR